MSGYDGYTSYRSTRKRQRSESPYDDDRNGRNEDRRYKSARHDEDEDDNDVLPQPFDARKLAPAKRTQTPTTSGEPRKQKRPGQRARITEAEREQIRQRQMERERQAQREAEAAAEAERRNAVNDVVRAHYNAVPERGRDWRKTDSRIKGLRSFNNWVKSCIIQKFSPDEDHSPGARERGISSNNQLLVLDIGCGKGGDLGKWQQAPQPVELYVGLDPADVSIDQARDRYRSMVARGGHGGRGGRGGYNRRQPPLFEARFHVKDCYGESIEDIDIIRQVGFASSNIGGPSHRGFDVVSMMFCMHYAFETEAKARQMLKNVAGALKKGGRFIGCIPNSDVISSRVEEFNKRLAEQQKAKEDQAQPSVETDGNTPKESIPNGDEKLSSDQAQRKPTPEEGEASEQTPKPDEDKEEGELEEGELEPTSEPKPPSDPTIAEWGNDIYRVRFNGPTPADGIFRPPFGWKYNFFLHEAVEEVPEYVVPWEAFRALAEDYNLELQYHKTFTDVWETEKDDRELGPLSERMGVRDRMSGKLLVSPEEMEAASFYVAFCFYKV
ncbi:guanine-N(7)-methyltransferase [Neurospora crassa]|uniref:mRNA cap guanine-N(7) methyltransferase n=1 Tax=Neurospora crassa (strain ATCC 24698 / 74-OR23-1A / CBS 708.71 / DSM 1257 / FGSC 987) TaxID=367110 RepID=Q7RZ98_NEUCR|nr:mRNA cap guanine-N7 methyltransferase [Neurospora crassa OR74A]EAA28374.1 mRNA cap guanine-N7 methyltransferase [Neurospora crassa OR74A]KHE86293.1 guanine-N(7)-methyltransferase [Neurospora crassa]|eukprot:XP_957610.1 mRNA cap guanine-N7 methyltransferase [Neurospora crassa OR74A]